MSNHHSHEHHDHSSHAHIPQDKKILALSFAIITGFMVVEFVGGYWFNSLALMADAGHMIFATKRFTNNPREATPSIGNAIISIGFCQR